MTCHEKVGWAGSAFVLPDRIIGTPEDRARLPFQRTSQQAPSLNAQSETLESWRQCVAALAKGNSRFVFAISAALAGPRIELPGQLSDGFNIRGASSSGKPTALRLATSVWGRLQNTSTPGALDGGQVGGRTGLRVLLPTRGMCGAVQGLAAQNGQRHLWRAAARKSARSNRRTPSSRCASPTASSPPDSTQTNASPGRRRRLLARHPGWLLE